MGQKPSWLNKIAEEVIEYYQSGHSLNETAEFFGNCNHITVYRLLKNHDVEIRSRSEGTSLSWTPKKREQYRKRRLGEPSPARGKTWTVDRPIEKPNLRGPKNPNWQGGKTELSRQIRTSAMYRRWRTTVFKRDDYSCVFCGAKRRVKNGSIIQADHITPLSVLIDRHNIESIKDARACEAIWDIDNGRTLCKKCHKNTSTYGLRLVRSQA